MRPNRGEVVAFSWGASGPSREERPEPPVQPDRMLIAVVDYNGSSYSIVREGAELFVRFNAWSPDAMTVSTVRTVPEALREIARVIEKGVS